jgi:hypothetical protein
MAAVHAVAEGGQGFAAGLNLGIAAAWFITGLGL